MTKQIKRLYEWTLSWAHSPKASLALAGIAFVESSFFPIPPDVLLIALALGRPAKAFRFALICTAGSVLGGLLGYLIGWGFFEAAGRPILEFYHAMGHYERVKALFEANALWIVFVAAFTPIPYKAITITAGVCQVQVLPFLLVSALGRGARFYLVAGMIRVFGPQVKGFIDKYFELLTLAFTALLIGGFVVLGMMSK